MRNATPTPRRLTKVSLIALAGLLGLSLSTSSISALLQAEAKNTTAQGITSGTLKLVSSDNGASFNTTITDVAPGDIVNRYVNYTNSGTLASKTLRLKVTDGTASPSLLTTSTTRGLQLTVTDCTGGAWTAATATCVGGTPTTLLTSPLASLGSDVNFNNITTLAANTGALHLQFSLSLPDSPNDEMTTNGTLPANTIQGLSASLTWTLSETQRAAATTNS